MKKKTQIIILIRNRNVVCNCTFLSQPVQWTYELHCRCLATVNVSTFSFPEKANQKPPPPPPHPLCGGVGQIILLTCDPSPSNTDYNLTPSYFSLSRSRAFFSHIKVRRERAVIPSPPRRWERIAVLSCFDCSFRRFSVRLAANRPFTQLSNN